MVRGFLFFSGVNMAKKIKMTNSELCAVVDDDYYEAVIQHTWHLNKGKPKATIDGKLIYLHTFLLGRAANKVIDHINGDGLDNRISNLRHCSQGQNIMNTMSRGGVSKYKGVDYQKRTGRWRARVRANGVEFHLGYYQSEENAALAYNEAAKTLHGEYARLNSVD